NNITGATADGVVQYNSPTGFQSTLVYRADIQSFATIAAATTSNIATNFIRPDFKLHGHASYPIVWSPATGLSSSTNTIVNAAPSVNTVYTVSANNNGCIASGSTSVSVVTPPVLSVNSNTSSVCEGESFTLTASGASTFTWNNVSTGSMVVVTPPAGSHV